MLKGMICWFAGHIQAYEAVEIEGKKFQLGFCARCRCGLVTFDPPIVIPAHSTVTLPVEMMVRKIS